MKKAGRPTKKTYETDTPFSRRLRNMMENRDITTKEMAGELRVSREAVGSWRRGKCEPSIEILADICKVLNVSADYMLGLKETM